MRRNNSDCAELRGNLGQSRDTWTMDPIIVAHEDSHSVAGARGVPVKSNNPVKKCRPVDSSAPVAGS